MRFLTIADLDLKGKIILIRVDYNVPMKDGVVTDTSRIDRSLTTLQALKDKGARIVILSHLGQPQAGVRDPHLSLAPVAEALSDALLGETVVFVPDTTATPRVMAAVAALAPGSILMMENLRFDPREEANNEAFAKDLATIADYYVNDAFSVSHRCHASVEAITKYLPSLAGNLMQEELCALAKVLTAPHPPLMAIVGGSKISTKFGLLEHLLTKVNTLVVGGAMAHTFLLAKGYSVGVSLAEIANVPLATKILDLATEVGCDLVIPSDVMVRDTLNPHAAAQRVTVDSILPHHQALDIGPTTVKAIQARIKQSATLLWNGPLGVFEDPPFDAGTNDVAIFVAQRTLHDGLISVAGGGDTLAALTHAGAVDGFSYVSTAGGAFLERIEGRRLPGIEALLRSGVDGDICSTKKAD